MDSALSLHRLQFAFTITFHYIFPQITMGLALLIVILKTIALRTGNAHYDNCALFWGRVFALNFALGVVTGIPMEFQFGTNWARFSKLTGAVIGQTLALEGMYSFFLESAFLGLFLYGRSKLTPLGHWAAAFAVFAGSWLSGYFIIVTDAWMQYPVGHVITPTGAFELQSLAAMLLNPWALWQYAHNMAGSVVTASFLMAATGAYYLLAKQHEDSGRTCVKLGVTAGLIASVLIAFPTGDAQGKMVAKHQPLALAAMEGLFETRQGAPMTVIGQPDTERRRIDNPIRVPWVLSIISHGTWSAEVKGLDQFPRDQWPDNLPLLFYSFHIMVGLGTLFIAITALSALQLWRGRLFTSRPLLWTLMLAAPLPIIANTAGWMTAELGRQPWLVYGLLRTDQGHSATVSAGNTMFSLLAFMGMYALLSILYLFLMQREIASGPKPAH